MRQNDSSTLTGDERARVPFALIGVLILATSFGVVTVADIGSDGTTDIDASRQISNTKGAVQTAVRDSARTALKRAAREPVTQAASTPAGQALGDSGDVFRRYVRLRVYLRAKENLESTGQTFGNGLRTEVSLPEVDVTEESIDAAIERVTLRPGSSSSLPTGKVNVTIEDVRIVARKDGEVVGSERVSVTTTVPSTVFVLHRKAREYQRQLGRAFSASDMATGDFSGFGNRLAWRLYVLANFKENHDRLTRRRRARVFTGKKILPKRQITILANDAAKNVQRHVFGTADPQLKRRMLGGYACLVAKIGTKLADGYASRSDSLPSAGTVCSVAAILSGPGSAVSGRIATIQGLIDRLRGYIDGDRMRSRSEITVDVDKVTKVTYIEVVQGGFDQGRGITEGLTDHTSVTEGDVEDNAEEISDDDTAELNDASVDLDAIIESVYRVNVTARTDATVVSRAEPTHTSPGPDYSKVSTTVTDHSVSVDVEPHAVWTSGRSDQTLYRYDITYRDDYQEEATWENSTGDRETTHASGHIEIRASVYVLGDYGVVSGVESRGIAHNYEAHPAASGVTVSGSISHSTSPGGKISISLEGERTVTVDSHNFEPALSAANEAVLGAGSPSAAAGELRSALDSGHTSLSGFRNALHAAVDHRDSPKTVDLAPENEGRLKDWILTDLRETKDALQEDSTVEPLRVSTTEMVTADNVFGKLADRIEGKQHGLVYEGYSGRYDTAADKALVKARRAYIEAVQQRLRTLEENRGGAKGNLADRVGGNVDSKLNAAKAAANPSAASGVSDGSFRDPPLLGDVKYSVDVTPSYLTAKAMGRAASPQIRSEYGGLTDLKDTAHAGLAIKNTQPLGEPGLPLIPYPPGWWYVSVNYWDIHVKGSYNRVAITATTADSSAAKQTTYIRQAHEVTLEIDGRERTVGSVEAIGFDTQIHVISAIPGLYVPPPPMGLPMVGRAATKPNDLCTATWPYVGPGFVRGMGSCPSSGGAGGPSLLPASALGIPTDVDDLDDIEAEPQPCNIASFSESLGSDARDWFGDQGPWEPGDEVSATKSPTQRRIVDRYCRLRYPSLKHVYSKMLSEGSYGTLPDVTERAEADWRRFVSADPSDQVSFATLENAVVRVRLLDDAHEIEAVMTGEAANEGEAIPPHRTDDLVVQYETGTRVQYGRVVDASDPGGRWFTFPWALEGKDHAQIVDEFALWDPTVVEPDSEAWAEYSCRAEVTVPEGRVFRISTAGEMEADEYGPLQEDLSGGVTQLHLVPASDLDDETSNRISEDRYELLGPVPGVLAARSDRSVVTDGGCPVEDREDDSEDLRVTYIDLAKGRSILVQTPGGENILIDAGSKSTTLEGRIAEVLDERGVSTIDKLVITHGDMDHVEFVDNLVGEVRIEQVYWNRIENDADAERALADAGIDIAEITSSTDLSTSAVQVDVLHPETVSGGDEDEKSVALMLTYEEERILVGSDVRDGSALSVEGSVDVLSPLHHGSVYAGANSEDWLAELEPDYVVISAKPSSSPSGNPDAEFLHRLGELGEEPATYITGHHGTITLTVDEEGINVRGDYDVTDPDELADEVPDISSLGPVAFEGQAGNMAGHRSAAAG